MLVSCLLALAPALPQTTWFVDSSAPAPGLGTAANPYSKIDYATSQPTTVTGDTVLIEPGSYLNEDIEIIGKGLRLQANGLPGSVTVVGGGGLSASGSGSSTLLRVEGVTNGVAEIIGLDFTGGEGEDAGTEVRGGAAYCLNSSLYFEDCSLSGKAHLGGALFCEGCDLSMLRTDCNGEGGPEVALNNAFMIVGGSIHMRASTAVLTDCDVSGLSRNAFPEGRVAGETTSFQDCPSVTITRGSITPSANSGHDYYSVGGRIYASNTSLRVDGTALANGGFSSSRGTGIAAVGGDLNVSGVVLSLGQGLRIQGDGIHLDGCTAIVDDCQFFGCGGTSEGDGSGSDFFYYGGAIYSVGAPLTVSNSLFRGNRGSRGGGIYAESGVISNCTFEENSALGSFQIEGQGGALWLQAGSIQDCVFTGNVASGDWGGTFGPSYGSEGFGGAAYVGSVDVLRCQFVGNTLSGGTGLYESQTSPRVLLQGGALYANGASSIRETSFVDNVIAPRTLFNPQFNMGIMGLMGIGVYLRDGGSVTDCQFEGNGLELGTILTDAECHGGGLYVAGGVATVSTTRFIENESESGGAIFNEAADLSVSLSVLRNNRVIELDGSNAAAVQPAIAGQAAVERCTIIGHAALHMGSSTDTLIDDGSIDSSILVGNRGVKFPASLAITYSIIDADHPGVGNIQGDPLFIRLPFDLRLWPASPAIDAGNPALTDPGSTSRADMGALPLDPLGCGSMCADPLGSILCTSNPNSTGLTGEAQAWGSVNASDEFLLLSATGLPPSVMGYFVTSDVAGFVPNFAGSAGNLCLGMPLYRLADQVLESGTSGRVGRAVNTQGLPEGRTIDPGSTWIFQFWHRDLGGPAGTSNTTSAVTVTFN